MGETTGISWCDSTFNPWLGCQKVSPACDGCYAEFLMAIRFGRVVWGPHGKRERTSDSYWRQPITWNKKALEAGIRPFVFGGSLCDPFDNAVQPEWRRDYFELIRATPALVWLLLTKRPQNIVKMAEEASGLPQNVAIGATTENQRQAEINAPHLLWAKARLRPLFVFFSCEPLLGPIDFRILRYDSGKSLPEPLRVNDEPCSLDALRGITTWPGCHYQSTTIPERHVFEGGNLWTAAGESIAADWIITGGESDQGEHKARPTHPSWTRSLRDQAAAAGVPYQHKQNGEFEPIGFCGNMDDCPPDDGILVPVNPDEPSYDPANYWVRRVGRQRAGRLLDGVLHDARPTVPPLYKLIGVDLASGPDVTAEWEPPL